MKKCLKYFMWGYQQHYKYNAQKYAEDLFGEISSDLKPQVFLVGLLREEIEGSYPICIEPEDCGVNINLFDNIDQLSGLIYESHPRRNMVHSEPDYHKRCVEDLKKECLVKAVKQLIDENFEGQNITSFVSYPVLLEGYEIFLVLQFSENKYCKFYSLNRSEVKITNFITSKVSKSLINSLVNYYLSEAIEPLYKPRSGVYTDEIKTDKKELLRLAAANFIGTAISAATQSHATYELFDICNYISSLKYEGDSSIGKLLICRENHPNIDIFLRLEHPIKLTEYRKVRKLLEVSSDNVNLYSNGDYILGLAKLKGEYKAENEDLFIINFSDAHQWEMIHASSIMMEVKYTNPMLPKPRIDKYTFDDLLDRILKDVSEDDLKTLWNIVNVSTEQKHGTLIIIHNDAKVESERLQNQSIAIKPTGLNSDIIRSITSIDGAVLLDRRGICYSMGVILDGIATSKGTSARGARFNSAIRYVEMQKKKCIAIIISEDGMVDLYPQLNPRIKKSEIAKRLIELREVIGQKTVDYDKYRPLMNWFRDNEFYLSKEECNEINELKNTFKSKLKMEVGMIYIDYPDFEPNVEMDQSYFIEENSLS